MFRFVSVFRLFRCFWGGARKSREGRKAPFLARFTYINKNPIRLVKASLAGAEQNKRNKRNNRNKAKQINCGLPSAGAGRGHAGRQAKGGGSMGYQPVFPET